MYCILLEQTLTYKYYGGYLHTIISNITITPVHSVQRHINNAAVI